MHQYFAKTDPEATCYWPAAGPEAGLAQAQTWGEFFASQDPHIVPDYVAGIAYFGISPNGKWVTEQEKNDLAAFGLTIITPEEYRAAVNVEP